MNGSDRLVVIAALLRGGARRGSGDEAADRATAPGTSPVAVRIPVKFSAPAPGFASLL